MSSNSFVSEVFQAAQSGDLNVLRIRLEASPELVNTLNPDGLSLLGIAAHFGHPQIVAILIKFGADVNAISRSQVPFIPSNTALHAAIAGERSLEVIRLLLHHQAKTTLYDSNGHTALHTAAFHDDNVEIIQLLLDHGADLHHKTIDGHTPFA
ncbi:ankyrin repeat domain-containing protein, partial [Neobacillus drentensis]|uniref:ankyrin repeat domain-containing protein n=1 Tax=Neobacillus drentensis TaxID=220684 RepID=UPI003001737B